jgi:teichuronic acid biosynthesis glycosyltransferase TuaG
MEVGREGGMSERVPVVSVVMPVFNADRFLLESMGSVVRQTFTDWELIVVDDGSCDDSWAVIEGQLQDLRIRALRLERNTGNPSTPRNIGIESARGRYIAFLDADDAWKPAKLDNQLQFMCKRACSVSYTSYDVVDIHGNSTGRVIPAAVDLDARSYLKNTIIGFSSSMVDRELIGEIRFKRYPMAEDALFWFELLGKGRPAMGLDQILMTYRVRPDSLSANKFLSSWWTWRIYRDETGLPLPVAWWYFLHRMVNSTLKRCVRRGRPDVDGIRDSDGRPGRTHPVFDRNRLNPVLS